MEKKKVCWPFWITHTREKSFSFFAALLTLGPSAIIHSSCGGFFPAIALRKQPLPVSRCWEGCDTCAARRKGNHFLLMAHICYPFRCRTEQKRSRGVRRLAKELTKNFDPSFGTVQSGFHARYRALRLPSLFFSVFFLSLQF